MTTIHKTREILRNGKTIGEVFRESGYESITALATRNTLTIKNNHIVSDIVLREPDIKPIIMAAAYLQHRKRKYCFVQINTGMYRPHVDNTLYPKKGKKITLSVKKWKESCTNYEKAPPLFSTLQDIKIRQVLIKTHLIGEELLFANGLVITLENKSHYSMEIEKGNKDIFVEDYQIKNLIALLKTWVARKSQYANGKVSKCLDDEEY